MTVKVPAVPTVKVVPLALLMTGAWSTTSVKVCVVPMPTELEGVKVRSYTPPVPACGVPLSTPVDGLNETPLGSVPV